MIGLIVDNGEDNQGTRIFKYLNVLHELSRRLEETSCCLLIKLPLSCQSIFIHHLSIIPTFLSTVLSFPFLSPLLSSPLLLPKSQTGEYFTPSEDADAPTLKATRATPMADN